ncbi:hypothetical protein GCM10009540_85570 [Streptomyces turgidiscabies]
MRTQTLPRITGTVTEQGRILVLPDDQDVDVPTPRCPAALAGTSDPSAPRTAAAPDSSSKLDCASQPQQHCAVGTFGSHPDPASGTSQDVLAGSYGAVPVSLRSLNDARVARSAASPVNEPPLSASGGSKCLGGSSWGAAEATPRSPTTNFTVGVALMPCTMTSAPTASRGQTGGVSWPEGSFQELDRGLRTVLSTLTPGPTPRAVQEALHRELTRLVFAETASVSDDPDERHVQMLLMRGHLMRLLGAVVPVDANEPLLEDDRLVVRVRGLLDEEIPGDAGRAAFLHRRMSEVGRELLAVLPAADAFDDVVDGWGRTVCAGFDSTRIREAILAAKSWEQAGVYPHPHILAAVMRALGGYVTTLVPYVSIHLESLSAGSRGWSACGEVIERSQEARDVPPGEGLKAAREHAFRLAVHTEALLRYAEQDCERNGE